MELLELIQTLNAAHGPSGDEGGIREKLAELADDPNKEWTKDELIERGQKVYAANCVACHQANGRGLPGSFPPLDGDPVVLGPKADAATDGLPMGDSTFRSDNPALADTADRLVVTELSISWPHDDEG